ncbi:MAG TPA: cohesin domain-containing protein, partial [bacterium]
MWRTSTVALIFLLIFFATSAFADVKVNLPDTTSFPKDTVNIPIRVSDLTGLGVYSYEYKLNVNSKIVHFIGVDSAKTLTEKWGATWINANNPSQVIIGNYGVNPLKNSGVLLFLRFAIIGRVGDSTQLDFQDFQFNSGNPVVKATDGSIKIIPNPISVSFKATVSDPVKILIDTIEKVLPFDTTWIVGETHSISAITPQYQSDNTRFTYWKWSDGKDTTHVVTPVSDTTFTVTMHKQYRLTVKSEYGHIIGNGWYTSGAMAQFSADSLIFQGDTTRYVFKMWQGAGENSYTGAQRTRSIMMNNPVTETAQWRIQHLLHVQSRYGNPVGAGWHDRGDTIAFTIDSLVVPVEGTRHRFDSWSGKGSGSYTGKNITPKVIMLAPISEQALWNTEHYLWIKSKPEGLIQTGKAGWYARNSVAVTNQADAIIRNDSYVYGFQNWSVDGQVVVSNPAQISMDTSHTAVANYKIDSANVRIETNVEKRTSIYVDGVRQTVPSKKFWKYQSKHIVGI